MTLRDTLHDLEVQHGPALVQEAIRYLPRIIGLIAKGRAKQITIALDRAHAQVDEALEARIRRDQGDGHQ
jgi:hypothetical protein